MSTTVIAAIVGLLAFLTALVSPVQLGRPSFLDCYANPEDSYAMSWGWCNAEHQHHHVPTSEPNGDIPNEDEEPEVQKASAL